MVLRKSGRVDSRRFIQAKAERQKGVHSKEWTPFLFIMVSLFIRFDPPNPCHPRTKCLVERQFYNFSVGRNVLESILDIIFSGIYPGTG